MLLPLLQNNMMGEAADLVTVPDVVGQTEASGTAELEAAPFAVSVKYAYSSGVAKGLIIEQSPTAGTDAIEGSTVTITVSLGEQSGGGLSKKRRKYFVEVDGQQFLVNDAESARQILLKARELAERQSQIKADRVVRRLSRKAKPVPEIKLPTPVIQVSPNLEADTAALRAEIEGLYRQAEQTAELRLLMLKKMQDDDEEDDLLLLL